uniref:Uncharacterized protein n=1 Tax=Anguilla anguilla TaxID=7936 RepID=A0A0E9UZ82_ANGAN
MHTLWKKGCLFSSFTVYDLGICCEKNMLQWISSFLSARCDFQHQYKLSVTTVSKCFITKRTSYL